MANFGSQFNTYGTVMTASQSPRRDLEFGANSISNKKGSVALRQRSRMTAKGTCVNLLFPWILFSLLYADLTFSVHFSSPLACWFFAVVGVLVALVICGNALLKVKEGVHNSLHAWPVWLVFLASTSLLAAFSGILLGNLNYGLNMLPYYELKTYNIYDSMNPQINHGQQFMDAGKVGFIPNAMLDLQKAYKFENYDQYCVAPISLRDASTGSAVALQSYDFWAVGLNCCGGNRTHLADFKCGAHSSTARQGLRLMAKTQSEFYKLAVEQAEAAFGIKASYPIFFHWTEDATQDMRSYATIGYNYFVLGVFCSLVVQIAMFLWAALFISKAGY